MKSKPTKSTKRYLSNHYVVPIRNWRQWLRMHNKPDSISLSELVRLHSSIVMRMITNSKSQSEKYYHALATMGRVSNAFIHCMHCWRYSKWIPNHTSYCNPTIHPMIFRILSQDNTATNLHMLFNNLNSRKHNNNNNNNNKLTNSQLNWIHSVQSAKRV